MCGRTHPHSRPPNLRQWGTAHLPMGGRTPGIVPHNIDGSRGEIRSSCLQLLPKPHVGNAKVTGHCHPISVYSKRLRTKRGIPNSPQNRNISDAFPLQIPDPPHPPTHPPTHPQGCVRTADNYRRSPPPPPGPPPPPPTKVAIVREKRSLPLGKSCWAIFGTQFFLGPRPPLPLSSNASPPPLSLWILTTRGEGSGDELHFPHMRHPVRFHRRRGDPSV